MSEQGEQGEQGAQAAAEQGEQGEHDQPGDLHVVATIPARAGSEDAIREALQTLVAATRQEEGCRGYDLYESASAPGTFVTVERWADQAALEAHMSTPHVAAAFAAAGDHLGGDVAIHPLVPVE